MCIFFLSLLHCIRKALGQGSNKLVVFGGKGIKATHDGERNLEETREAKNDGKMVEYGNKEDVRFRKFNALVP